MDNNRTRYIHAVLQLYRDTPTVLGHIRPADRECAGQLYDRAVPLYAVEYAFVTAAARRVLNNAFATPLPPIRSLHYFRAVIQEILERPPGPADIDVLRRRLTQRLNR